MHALIIEDDAYTAEMLQYAVTDMGAVSATLVSSEEAAIQAAKRNRPDIVCADVTLSSGSGIRAVKSICGAGNIPAIFVTASPDQVAAHVPNGIVVAKPFSFAEVKAAIQRALARKA